jgi:DNA segregation ATPase FtsK/SpoIIIE, S-DNA-T family
MAVELNVRDIRHRLLGGGLGFSGDEGRDTAVSELGNLFHNLVAEFFTRDSALYLMRILEDVESSAESWRQSLVDAVYREFVGPTLERNRAALAQFSREVELFWDAVINLCDWLAGILFVLRQQRGSLDASRDLVDCQRMLRVELREPSWDDTVVLAGPADSVVRTPESLDWCVVVLKTAGLPADADLRMAALYNLLLSASDIASETTRVVSFTPTVKERVVSETDLAATRERLKAAIGRIAGVDKTAAEPATRGACPWSRITPEHLRMQQDLLRVLANYGLDATIDGPPLLGPTFIRFMVRPACGAKVAHFTGLTDEIALGMNLKTLPMIERLGGQIAVDIERPDRHAVEFEALRPLLPITDPLQGNSRLLVGVDMAGNPVFIDLAKPEHCHVLVVGTAGSGKSIWLRAAIASLVETNTPATLQLVLIDPKRNAFTAWRESEHLREPIVFPDEVPAVDVFHGLIEEMEDRYRRMAEAYVDDLRGLIRKENRTIPRIVCVCDEYADLVSHSDDRKEIEACVARLGAKSRAAGIHLILATQTPRREIIGGTIKANLPTCIGLRVSSGTEARVIETPGAELLLGNGDLLLRSIGEPRRLQGVLVEAGSERPELAAVGAK